MLAERVKQLTRRLDNQHDTIEVLEKANYRLTVDLQNARVEARDRTAVYVKLQTAEAELKFLHAIDAMKIVSDVELVALTAVVTGANIHHGDIMNALVDALKARQVIPDKRGASGKAAEVPPLTKYAGPESAMVLPEDA